MTVDQLQRLDPFAWKPLIMETTRVALMGLIEANIDMRPEDLHKLLPKDSQIISDLLLADSTPVEVRAKILEVALLRGGSAPYSVLEELASGNIGVTDFAMIAELTKAGLLSTSPHQATEILAYQAMAIAVTIRAQPDARELFAELSRSGDWINNRQPATQLMHIMLQEGGRFNPNNVEDWMLRLPPEERGRAMNHLYDAAANKDIAGGFKLDTVYVEGAAGPFTLGASFRYENTHWQRTVNDIQGKVVTEIKKSGEVAIDAYNKGLAAANRNPGGPITP